MFDTQIAVIDHENTQIVLSAPFGGSPGVGVPSGGTTGQALVKLSSTDYDIAWASVSGGTVSGGTGTVTSVGLSVPTGLTINGSPITTSGDFVVTYASGYSLPTIEKQNNWDAAFNERNQWDGGTSGLVAASGRASLGLGNVAVLNVGTVSGTVAAGNDFRFIPSGGSAGQVLSKASASNYDVIWISPSESSSGTVTNVGLIAPLGFSVSASPVTTSGTISLAYASGYSLPTIANQGEWNTAFSERNQWNGSSAGLNAASGRTSLGLGNSATRNVGTASGTVAAGDDARFTEARTPLAHKTSHSIGGSDALSPADIGAELAGTSASGIAAHIAAADPHPSYALESSLGNAATRNVGTISGTVAAGDDARFLPSGGTSGQILAKNSNGNYDVAWISPSGSSGGTVSSVGLIMPTGFTANGSPVTASGDIIVVFASGYSLPTITKQSDWDTAFSQRNQWDGGALGLNAASGRTNLGLGSAAVLNVGTASGTVAAGNDSRFLPSGGSAGQVLSKASTNNYDVIWISPSGASGGTVSSVGLTVPTGFTVANSPVTTSGSILLSFASGYSLPTIASQSNWDVAFNERNQWDGGSAGLNAPSGRTSLGLGDSAVRNVGTASGTVAAGNDSRFVPSGGTTGQFLRKSSNVDHDDAWASLSDVFVLACSDETTALTTGTNKIRFRMPYAGTLTAVRASVNTAPTGAALVVDINEAGTTLLSTKLSIDATETSSTTAATPAVISDSALADNAEISVDIDQIGSSVAGAGLKVMLYVTRN